MEQINELLKQVHDFNLKTQAEKNAQRKRGELFNVFNILNLSTNETRTHSAFLAELLRPDGSHGMQDTFLKLFLESVTSLQDFDFKTENAKVAVEYSVGLINEDATEGGRLDILITSENSEKKAIIIENKIYAEDQKNQLVRYDNFAKSYNEHKLLYLTLFGSDASGYSTGNQDSLDYTSIGYNDEILKWLDLCVKESVRRPKVRETIEQYIHLIKQLTYQDMDNNELIKIVKGDLIEAVAICRVMPQVKEECFKEFWNNLYDAIKDYGGNKKWSLNFAICEGTQFVSKEYYSSNRYDDKRRGLEIEIGDWKDCKLIFRIAVVNNLHYGFILRGRNGEIVTDSNLQNDILTEFSYFDVKWTQKTDEQWVCWKYPAEGMEYNFWEFNDNIVDLILNKDNCFDTFIEECRSLIDGASKALAEIWKE